ncbi:MAG: ZIP family metal transporter [Candidatus Micrarchaeota archaeon]
MVFWLIVAATLIVCLASLVGIASFWVKPKLLNKLVLLLVAFSAGTLMGGAFLHLMPEALEEMPAMDFSLVFLASFSLFFVLERVVKWRHCHADGSCDVHSFGYVSLFGDAVHNFVDGLIIAASFIASVPVGIATTVAVLFHELPQEIGDFAILIHAGFSRKKALAYNFLVSLSALVGAVIGFYLSTAVESLVPFLLPVAAGSFVYIASSDLIPELHKEPDFGKAMRSFVFFVLGLVFMYAFKLFFA